MPIRVTHMNESRRVDPWFAFDVTLKYTCRTCFWITRPYLYMLPFNTLVALIFAVFVLIFICSCPPLPYHPTLWIVWKHLRPSPANLPYGSWYVTCTKHLRLFILIRQKSRTQQSWDIKPVLHNFVRRIRCWRIKPSDPDFEYLKWTISTMIFWNLFTSKWTKIIDWVRQLRSYCYSQIH